jgi:hypothetical protein
LNIEVGENAIKNFFIWVIYKDGEFHKLGLGGGEEIKKYAGKNTKGTSVLHGLQRTGEKHPGGRGEDGSCEEEGSGEEEG